MIDVAMTGLPLDYPFTGTAVYTQNIASRLSRVSPEVRCRLFVRNASVSTLPPDVCRLTSPVSAWNRGSGLGARIDKLAWEVVMFPLAATAHHASLLHYTYLAAPVKTTTPLVVTVHDLIPLVVPDYHRSRQSAIYSRLMARNVKRAHAIITVSEFSRRDIVRVLEIPENRVFVTHEAVDDRFSPEPDLHAWEHVSERFDVPERYVLYAGGCERRKNLETLVRAWSVVRTRMEALDVSLVIVAAFPPPDRLYPDIPALIRDLGLGDSVRVIPHVEEDDKPGLYRRALAFCYPSTYEGFGLPPLEAMASGVPVVASNSSSIPEVVGDGALLVGPYDVGGWAEAIRHVVESRRDARELSARGLRRASVFSWESTVEKTVAVYRTVLAS